jgi:hydroxymethylpyrimidine pyrophosphatase-like HAD family hydrolase
MEPNSKIFIFSDIDDTLIQTARKTNFDKESSVFVVDREGEPISYIYKSVEKLLQATIKNDNIVLIPTTARSIESYHRTRFSTDATIANKIEYAVLNFGGVILKKGEVDREWQEHIDTQYANLGIKIEKMYENIIALMDEHFGSEHGLKIRLIENFYVDVLNKKNKLDEVYNKQIETLLKEYLKGNEEYYLYINGPSFALLPHFLNKSTAVKHLIEKYDPILTIGAGDNSNDLEFMFETDFLVLPNNSYNSKRLK